MARSRIANRFGRAVVSYDAHSGLQRHAARRLDEVIGRVPLPARPRILEIGCGTGHLTRLLAHRLAGADFFATDIAPAMVAACRESLPGPAYAVMDGERPAVAGGFDLVCANLAAQWFDDLGAAIARLVALLAPGGVLAMTMIGDRTFEEWRAAHRALGLTPGTPDFPSAAGFSALFPLGGELILEEEHRVERAQSPLAFLRELRGIGADTPAAGHRPLSAGELRRVLRQLGAAPNISYQLLYARWRKSPG